jgi:hypothetical protein
MSGTMNPFKPPVMPKAAATPKVPKTTPPLPIPPIKSGAVKGYATKAMKMPASINKGYKVPKTGRG